MSNLLRRVALALLFLGLAAAGLAFTFLINEDTQLPIKWPAGTVRLRIMLGDTKVLSDGQNYNSIARTAAGSWNSVIGAIQFETELLPAGQPGEQTGSNPPQTPRNELAFTADVFGHSFGDALAVTTVWRRGNERGEADILFNTAYQWDSYLGALRYNEGKLVPDLRRVALHELGHVLGLGHSDAAGQVNPPSSIMTASVGDLYIITTDDIAGARSLYGPPSGPANDNFANAFTITMAGNRSVSVTGHNTKATQETGELRQGDNPGGRSVWWRWLAPSAGGVALDTKGSYYDTTLGVYTGSSVTSLVQVAHNDDIDPGVRQNSSLAFTASAGTEYRIAVDGYNAIELFPTDTAGADNGGITLNLSFDGSLGTAPTITTHPANATIPGGSNGSLSVLATGSAPLSYQWYHDNSAIVGATNSSLTVVLTGNYTVSVTNAAGTVTSNPATITFAVSASSPPSSSSGGGGGGGAPSLWFCAGLAGLGLARLRRLHR